MCVNWWKPIVKIKNVNGANIADRPGSEDQTTFTRAAHSAKSTSLTFGALGYANLARELEMLGSAGKLEKLTKKASNWLILVSRYFGN